MCGVSTMPCATRQPRDVLDRVVDADVRIQVGDARPTFVEQSAQQERLDRRRQLGDVIDGGEPANLRAVQTEIAQMKVSNPAVCMDTAAGGVDIDAISNEDSQRSVGMMREQRIGEDSGERQVIASDDGARIQHGG